MSDADSALNHVNGCSAQGMPILITLSYIRSAVDTDYQYVKHRRYVDEY